MTNNSNKTGKDFKAALNAAGVHLPAVVATLQSHLVESKEHYQTLNGIMDKRTKLEQKVKLLELELFIEVLKKC